MRALVTGITGFVGRYLADHLIEQGFEVWGTTRKPSAELVQDGQVNIITLDLNNQLSITDVINEIGPDQVFHLAGQSNVKRSWDHKIDTFEANVNQTIHLLEAIRNSEHCRNIRILTVGSAEEYGRVLPEEMPIKEENALRPMSPYGVTKATISMLAQQYHRAYGLNIVHVRPFNHIGPCQGTGFVTADFAKQLAQIEAGLSSNEFRVGNLDALRDFLDVRDIVRAYSLIISGGQAGEVYNVCSGHPVSIQSILNFYMSEAVVPIHIIKDESLLRPIDMPLYVGSNEKLKNRIQWGVTIDIEESLTAIMNYWRTRIDKDDVRHE